MEARRTEIKKLYEEVAKKQRKSNKEKNKHIASKLRRSTGHVAGSEFFGCFFETSRRIALLPRQSSHLLHHHLGPASRTSIDPCF
jgi:hypothetical protein